MPSIVRIFQSILALALLSTPALAEPVSVNRGTGLGYTFTHRGNCYVILPDHVRSRQMRLSLSTAAPIAVGDAEVFKFYGPEMDLAIGVVTSGLDQRCTDSFDSLRPDLQPLLDRNADAQLIRVEPSGLEQHIDMIITSFDFESITARVSDRADAEIFKGTSGGILRIGNKIVGMAVQSSGIEEGYFLRADEIAARLGRLLDTGSGNIRLNPPAPPPPDAASLCPAGSITLTHVQCSAEPLRPELACANLLAGGVAAFPPSNQPPRLVFSLPDNTAVPVSRVSLGSTGVAPSATMPKGVIVEISSSSGTPRWRRFGAGDMPPTGKLSLVNGSAPYASQVAITLQSSWDAELPIALDCITIQ